MKVPEITLDWDETVELTRRLARKIQAAKVEYDVFMAVARGGSFPVLLLAQVFDGINLATHMRRYNKAEMTDTNNAPHILSFPRDVDIRNKRVLVVDEVWHSGDSIVRVVQEAHLYEPLLVHTAVLHFRPDKNRFPLLTPTYFVEEASAWIVYPWEMFTI